MSVKFSPAYEKALTDLHIAVDDFARIARSTQGAHVRSIIYRAKRTSKNQRDIRLIRVSFFRSARPIGHFVK